MRHNKQNGFTLIELLVVVSLIIVVVGVTGDIVVSLVRSYNKTQITTEVEQNANFAMGKLERELRNAYEIVDLQLTEITFRRQFAGGVETITYSLEDAGSLSDGEAGVMYIARAVDGASSVPVTNYTSPSGVNVESLLFVDQTAASGPNVVRVTMAMRQIGNPVVQFTQSTQLENTIIVRGSY